MTIRRFYVLALSCVLLTIPRIVQSITLTQTTPIQLEEGSHAILNASNIQITGSESSNYNIEVVPYSEANGYFANVSQLDIQLLRFTYNDIVAKTIVFVSSALNKPLEYEQPVIISDEHSTLNTTLHISATPMLVSAEVHLSLDTTCVGTIDLMTHQSLLLSSDLVSVTASQSGRVPEVMTHVVQAPLYGDITSQNTTLNSPFSYSLIQSGAVSYTVQSSDVRAANDTFQLQFSIGHGRSDVVTVPVCILPLPYPTLSPPGVLSVAIMGESVIEPVVLSADHDRAVPNGAAMLRYNVVDPPKHGILSNLHTREERITLFTQADIDSGYILYENTRTASLTDLTDSFTVRLSNDYHRLDATYRVEISLYPANLEVVNNRITVEEGATHVITPLELFAIAPAGYDIAIYILQQPACGDLVLKRPDPAPIIPHIQYVDLPDIVSGHVRYIQDIETECPADNFHFIVIANNRSTSYDSLEFKSKFNITINLTNNNPPTREYVEELSILPGATKPITTEQIWFSDSDYGYDDNNLIYTLVYGPGLGRLCLHGNCSSGVFGETFKWTQGDMANGDLLYQSSGLDSSNSFFLFTVSDGKHDYNRGEWVLFGITLLDLVANRTASAPLRVLEGSEITVAPSNLYYTANNEDVSSSDFMYRLTDPPGHGSLEFEHGGLAELFTQQDIDEGNVVYRHYGDNNVEDSFKITMTIKTFVSGEETVDVVIEPVDDDYPRLSLFKQPLFIIDVGGLIHLDNTMLQITDTDTSDINRLTYTVIRPPQHGILQKRATPNSDSYTNCTSFTQFDLRNMNVRYEHMTAQENPPQLQDSFTFGISDGTNSLPANYTMGIVIIGTIGVTVYQPTVPEGGQIRISRSSIEIDHPYFSTVDVTFNIIQYPTYGTILNGQCSQSCPIFDSADLDRGQVKYIHNGSETLHDYFEFRIELPESRSTQQFTYPIAISPINDEKPVIIKNDGLSVWASQITPITSLHLLTEDADTPPNKILYRFHLNAAELLDGYFASSDVLNVSKTEFVQEEINNGSLVFVDTRDYDGSRELQFTVTDNKFSINGTFVISATFFKIQQVGSKELHVDMGGTAQLNLKTFTNLMEQDSPAVMFHLVTPPTYGRLVDSRNQDVEIFQQSDVESLTYIHTAVDMWEPVDYINVTARHPYLISPKMMYIVVKIALRENPNSPFVSLQSFSLKENARHCLNQSNLDARNVHYYTWKDSWAPQGVMFTDTQLEYRVVSPLLHGFLLVGGTTASVFSHDDITAGIVCYQNSGVEHNSDSLVIEACINGPNESSVCAANDTLPIMIELYNDEPPELVTTNLHQNFVVGFPLTLDLIVLDRDSSQEEIKYTITTPSSIGFVQLNGNTTQSFTQADVANGLVTFLPTEIGNSSFEFQYSDSNINSEVVTFSLAVLDLNFHLVANKMLTYLQTQSEAILTSTVLNTSTNGLSVETKFHIATPPLHGDILLAGKKVTSFSQLDIDHELVAYHQTDNAYYHDSLTLTASNREKTIDNITINILVEMAGSTSNDYHLSPLLSQPLPAEVIDLSVLQDYSFRPPVIELTSSLKYGYISYHYSSATPITSFDYRELEDQHVYYTWMPVAGLNASAVYTEVFEGIVKLDNLPPGIFSFSISLQPPEAAMLSSESSTVVQPSNSPTASEESQEAGSDSNSFIWPMFLPIIGVLALAVMATLVFLVFCCCQYKRIKRKLAQKTGLDLLSKKHPASRGPSPRLSPTRPFHSPPMAVPDLDADSMDSESSSAADIMMMHTNQQTQQVMTISANHTQFPHVIHSSSGYYTQGPTMTPYSDCDSYAVSPTPYQQGEGLQDARWLSHSPTRMEAQMHFGRSGEVRANSPVRRSTNFKRSVRPYNSLSTVNGGATAMPKSLRDYHLRGRDQMKDSVSSLGYESSNTQESVSQRPSVVSLPAVEPPSANQENPDETDTIHAAPPILKDCEYWV